jgi:hypothetical protein
MLSIYDKTIYTYEHNDERIKELEGIQNDLMHEISLGKKRGVVDGYKLYEKMRDVLVERYEKRDVNDELKPLYDYLKSNVVIKNSLNRVLVDTKSEAERLANRAYTPRVLHCDELTMKTNDTKGLNKNLPLKDRMKEIIESNKTKDIMGEFMRS